MEKLSHLAFHPVKMQSCYEKMEQLKLEGLQQRFDVSSTSVFKQRAQIHMRQVGQALPAFIPVSPQGRAAGVWGQTQPSPFGPPLPLTSWLLSQQMDDALYTFETLLHQELGKLQGKDELCKSIQRILERVLKVRAGVALISWGLLG